MSDEAPRRTTELSDGEVAAMPKRVESRTIVHHEGGIGLTRIVCDGPMMLDPPGITLIDCIPPGVA